MVKPILLLQTRRIICIYTSCQREKQRWKKGGHTHRVIWRSLLLLCTREHWENTYCNRLGCHCWLPILPKQTETNVAIRIDVLMLRKRFQKINDGRFHWVVRWEDELQLERLSFILCLIGTNYCHNPWFQITLCGHEAICWRIREKRPQFLHPKLCDHLKRRESVNLKNTKISRVPSRGKKGWRCWNWNDKLIQWFHYLIIATFREFPWKEIPESFREESLRDGWADPQRWERWDQNQSQNPHQWNSCHFLIQGEHIAYTVERSALY